jgi:hypothetical protein
VYSAGSALRLLAASTATLSCLPLLLLLLVVALLPPCLQ